jgi:hypothetical protein
LISVSLFGLNLATTSLVKSVRVTTKKTITSRVIIIDRACFLGYFLKNKNPKRRNRGVQVGILVTVDQNISYCSIPRLFK